MPSHTMLFIQFLIHIFIVCIYLFENINIYIFTSKSRFFLLDQTVEGALKQWQSCSFYMTETVKVTYYHCYAITEGEKDCDFLLQMYEECHETL